MPKPLEHAELDVRKFGGRIEDYIEIHNWFDATKSWIPDNRHRAMRHHSQGIFECESVFGDYITNSDGRKVSVREIGEGHVLLDFGTFIPTAQDYLQEMDLIDWMQNGRGSPPSHARILKRHRIAAGITKNEYKVD